MDQVNWNWNQCEADLVDFDEWVPVCEERTMWTYLTYGDVSNCTTIWENSGNVCFCLDDNV